MRRLLQGVACVCVLCGAMPAVAQDSEIEYSANVGLVSKYLWRGWVINSDLSASGGFDVNYKGFYAGIWGGSDENLGTEYDLYLGYAGEFGDNWNYDVGFIQYRYPNNNVEVNEAHMTLGYRFLSATYHRGEDDYDYIELNANFELTDKLGLELHVGHEDNTWRTWKDYKVSLNYQLNDNYSVYLGATDKEDNDSNFFVGLQAFF